MHNQIQYCSYETYKVEKVVKIKMILSKNGKDQSQGQHNASKSCLSKVTVIQCKLKFISFHIKIHNKSFLNT